MFRATDMADSQAPGPAPQFAAGSNFDGFVIEWFFSVADRNITSNECRKGAAHY